MAFWKPGEAAPGVGLTQFDRGGSSGGRSFKSAGETVVSVSAADDDGDSAFATAVVYNPHSNLTLTQQRRALPIFDHRRTLLYLIEHHPVVVVIGETGCGKSTQIPQYLYEAGWADGGRVVLCTQPRRVAASTVAARVAQEQGCVLGSVVGYGVRFDECADREQTRVKYVTDGVLVRETMSDPLLARYSVIMIDEAHERHLHTDILLGLLKKIQRRRPDLRLVIASATMDAEEMRNFFDDGPAAAVPAAVVGGPGQQVSVRPPVIFRIPGRTFPVDVFYSVAPVPDYLHAALETVLDIHRDEPAGDILVFLTGQAEIEALVTALQEDTVSSAPLPPRRQQQQQQQQSNGRRRPLSGFVRSDSEFHQQWEQQSGEGSRKRRRGDYGDDDDGQDDGPVQPTRLLPLPLFSGLPAEAQARAFEPAPWGVRKVVVATNIAEASVTLDGVVFVVDSGFVKLRVFDPGSGADALVVAPTSRQSTTQRAGRAGRNRPGKCFRLYTEPDWNQLPLKTAPEMQRTNLAPIVIQLKALGVADVLHFDFPAPPPALSLAHALELLYALGALDDDGRLTEPLGLQLAELPLPPTLGRSLLEGLRRRCAGSLLDVCAALSVQSLFDESALPTTATGEFTSADPRRGFAVYEGDHLTLVNVISLFRRKCKDGGGAAAANWCSRCHLNYRALLRALDVRRQLAHLLRRFGWSGKSDAAAADTDGPPLHETIRKCILAGSFPNAAQFRQADGSYRTARGSSARQLFIHPSSVLFRRPPAWIVFHELVETTKSFVRDVSAIEPHWLLEVAPTFYQLKTNANKSGPATTLVMDR